MECTDTHRSALADIMLWRRDVRHFAADPVPDDTLRAALAAIDLAPSVGNARPWRFIRVVSVDRRAAVMTSFEQANAHAAQGYEGTQRAAYLQLKLAGLREAPEHFAVFTDTACAAGAGLGRQTMPEMLAYSTVTAIHTFWLAARALNLGVGWVSILDPGAVADALDVPTNWQLTGYLCVGYPERADDTPLLHRAQWQANAATEIIER